MKKKLAHDVDVALIAGTDGVFEVVVDNSLVFSKKKLGRFPDDGEIAKLINEL